MTESEIEALQESIKEAVFINDDGSPQIVIQRGLVRITIRPYDLQDQLHVSPADVPRTRKCELNATNFEMAMRELLA